MHTCSELVLFALDFFSLDVSHRCKVSRHKRRTVSFRHGTIKHIRGNARFRKPEISVSIAWSVSGKYPPSASNFFHLDILLVHAFLKDWFGFGYGVHLWHPFNLFPPHLRCLHLLEHHHLRTVATARLSLRASRSTLFPFSSCSSIYAPPSSTGAPQHYRPLATSTSMTHSRWRPT